MSEKENSKQRSSRSKARNDQNENKNEKKRHTSSDERKEKRSKNKKNMNEIESSLKKGRRESKSRSTIGENKPMIDMKDIKSRNRRTSSTELRSHESATRHSQKFDHQIVQPIYEMPSDALQYKYEDDFEDYSDDFEDDSGVKLNDKFEIPADEKQGSSMLKRILARSDDLWAKEPRSRSSSKPQNAGILSTTVIDFKSATTTNVERIAEVQRRYEVLKNLLGLEILYYDFADIHPVKDYEFYIHLFGNSNQKQVLTQTGDDDVNRSIQTDEIEGEDKWTQYPAIEGFGCGTAPTHTCIGDKEDVYSLSYVSAYWKDDRLSKFISTAEKVVMDLLMYRKKDDQLKLRMKKSTNSVLKKGYFILSLDELASKFEITYILKDSTAIFVSYFIDDSSNQSLIKKSLLAEFSTNDLQMPQRLMLCNGRANCFCYFGEGNRAAVVGLDDGSCVCFDLTESAANFLSTLQCPDLSHKLPLRMSSYDTSFLYFGIDIDEGHWPIISIHGTESSENRMRQVISANEVGIIMIWSLHDVTARDNEDLGLRPGAKLKMSLVHTLRPMGILENFISKSPCMKVRSMLLNPIDESECFIGTDFGQIITSVRSNKMDHTWPRLYKIDPHLSSEVICQRFSPFDSSIMLVGLSNGNLVILKVGEPGIQLTLKSGEETLRQIEFSPSCSSIFYSIHGSNHIIKWDLSKSESPRRIAKMEFGGETFVSASATWKTKENTNGTGFLALGLSNGLMQMHLLDDPPTINSISLFDILVKLKNKI